MSGQTDQSPVVSRAFTARLREVLTARLPADPRWVVWVGGVVEELAGADAVSVDATLAQGIDRDALTPEEAVEDLRDMLHAWDTTDDPPYYDDRPYGAGVEDTWNRVKSVLALVRPVEAGGSDASA